MLTMEQLIGQKVFVPRPPSKAKRPDGTPAPPKRFGKVHHLVFSPQGTRVVGLMVKRPDVAGMIKREDAFVALDRLGTFEGGLLIQGDDALDAAAAKRLGLDLDRCIIWGGMDVVTEDGDELGYVSDISFDFDTGALETLYVTDGALAASVVGSVPVTAGLLLGHSKGRMVVKNEARDVELTGGLAAKAGRGFAQAKEAGKEAASKAGKVAGEAVDKGSFALGRAIGTAKRSVKEALATEEEPSPAAPTPAEAVSVEAPAPAPRVGGAVGEGEPATYAPVPEKKEPATPKDDERGPMDEAARAVGRQLGKTQGMFKAFLKEFEEASK